MNCIGPRENLSDAVSPACTLIIRALRSLGPYEGRQAARLNRATIQIEGVSQAVSNLIQLLARSRTVELEIIQRQFGSLIAPDLLSRVKQDLSELAASLNKEGD